MPNYLEIIGNCFEGVQVQLTPGGDPTVYGDIIWISTQIAQATLDTVVCTPADVIVLANTEGNIF